MKAILFTRHDGGVSICRPAPQILPWMSCGGFYGAMPRGFVDDEIDRTIAAGHENNAAARFVRALAFGGASEPEAYAIIRDRDCGHRGTGFELIEPDALPDRWFRDAWRRSHNGGPISIDLGRAKAIQFARVRTSVDLENKRRQADLERFDRPIEPKWGTLRDLIVKADNPENLKHVWPDSLPIGA